MRPRALPLLLVVLCSTVGSLPATAHAAPRPNLLLILTDDQTFDALDPGAPVVMPQLEAHLADPNDHWVQFPNFFFNNPLCCPSRATILTGLYDTHTGVQTNAQGAKLDDTDTIATRLQTEGYRTALVGKYLNGYPFTNPNTWIPPGWDQWYVKTGAKDLGYYDYDLNENGTVVSYHSGTNAYSTDLLANRAAGVITSTPANQPLFMELALAAPHLDPIPAPRYTDAFLGLTLHHAASFNEADVSDKPAWVQHLPRYDATGVAALDDTKRKHYETLLAVDDAVQTMLDTLSAAGRLDNTVVVFMTDNGFSFGEHRWEGKRCEYDICLRSPFFVRFPGAEPGVDPHLVSNVDIAPTFEQLAGESPLPPTDGLSLVPLLEGSSPPTWRSGVLAHNLADGSDPIPTWWAIRTSDYAYVEIPRTGEVELYDIAGRLGPADPDELQNVAGRALYAGVKSDLASQLDELQGVDLSLSVTDNPDPVSVGGVVAYTIIVRNGGIGDAHGVTLNDPVPAGMSLVSVKPSQGSCDASVSCSLGDIDSTKKATVTISVAPSAAGTVTDTATAASSIADQNPADDSATASTTVQPASGSADLGLTMKDSPDPVAQGSAVTYILTVSNAGPSIAQGVTVTNPVPAGSTFVSASPSTDCSIASGVVTCSLGNLQPSSSTTVKVKLVPSSIGTLTDTATASSWTPDPTTGDLSASETTTVVDPRADLSVSVTDSPDPIALGSGNLTYKVQVVNLGPASASHTSLTDQLPANVTVVSLKPSTRCDLSGTVVTCGLGTIAPGAHTSITIVVTPTAAGSLLDQATVSSAAPDPNHSNDTASATTTVT